MDENTKVNLYWGNDAEGYLLKEENVTAKEAWRQISLWRETHAPALHLNGKGIYRSHITSDGVQHIDYGSHHNFFKMEPILNKKGDNKMENIFDFCGNFDSFDELMDETEMYEKVVRFFTEDGDAVYKIIVGSTAIPGDILLHMVDAEGMTDISEIDEAIKNFGLEFQKLSTLLGTDGMEIVPFDQLDDEDNEQSSPDSNKCATDCKCENKAETKETAEEKEMKAILKMLDQTMDLLKNFEDFERKHGKTIPEFDKTAMDKILKDLGITSH